MVAEHPIVGDEPTAVCFYHCPSCGLPIFGALHHFVPGGVGVIEHRHICRHRAFLCIGYVRSWRKRGTQSRRRTPCLCTRTIARWTPTSAASDDTCCGANRGRI